MASSRPRQSTLSPISFSHGPLVLCLVVPGCTPESIIPYLRICGASFAFVMGQRVKLEP